MAPDARPSTVRRAAVVAAAGVVLVGLGAFLWRDDVGASAVRPLWDRATADARTLLLFDGPLVVVIGAVPAVVVVAVVAWQRERSRPVGVHPFAPPPARPGPSGRRVSDLVGPWRGSGRLGWLFAALAGAGACFAVYGTVESIWGDPSLRLSILTLAGAALTVVGVGGPDADERRSLRRAVAMVAATVALSVIVLPSVRHSDQLSLGQAVALLREDEGTRHPSSPRDRYARVLVGDGPVEVVAVTTEELGLVIVAARHGGYEEAHLVELRQAARALGLPATAAFVHRGVGVIVVGDATGLESLSGADRRDRVRELLDG